MSQPQYDDRGTRAILIGFLVLIAAVIVFAAIAQHYNP